MITQVHIEADNQTILVREKQTRWHHVWTIILSLLQCVCLFLAIWYAVHNAYTEGAYYIAFSVLYQLWIDKR